MQCGDFEVLPGRYTEKDGQLHYYTPNKGFSKKIAANCCSANNELGIVETTS